IALPEKAGERIGTVELLVTAKGYGPAWGRHFAGRPELELRMPPEEPIVGTLIDLTGQPVPGAKVRPVVILGEATKPVDAGVKGRRGRWRGGRGGRGGGGRRGGLPRWRAGGGRGPFRAGSSSAPPRRGRTRRGGPRP